MTKPSELSFFFPSIKETSIWVTEGGGKIVIQQLAHKNAHKDEVVIDVQQLDWLIKSLQKIQSCTGEA